MDEPATILRSLFDAFAKRDLDAVRRLISPDAAWVVPGSSRLAGTHRGHEEILAYFARIRELSGGTYRADAVDLLASPTRAAALARASAQREGRVLAQSYIFLAEIADGRIRAARIYPEDGAAFDAFWS